MRFSRHQFAVANCKAGQRVEFSPRYKGDIFPFVIREGAP